VLTGDYQCLQKITRAYFHTFRKDSNGGMIDLVCHNLRLMLAVIDRSNPIRNKNGD
jgi:hypothetical protein